MPDVSPDSLVRFALPVSESSHDHPSRLEDQVVRLFDDLRSPVLRYLVSLGLSPSEGEEIAQEVFLGLFRHLQQGKAQDHLRAWVFRVARNLALRRHRSKRRKPEELFGLSLVTHRDPVDPLPNPEEQTIHHNRHARLLAAFYALPELSQQTLHLRAEGLRYREIAEILGTSLTTVAVTISRSLERLQKVYES